MIFSGTRGMSDKTTFSKDPKGGYRHHDEFERRLAGKPAVEYRTAWTEIAPITASRLAVRLQAPAMPV